MSSFYYVRNRFYNQQFGTWVQRDPLGSVAGTNLYSYADNSPLGATDPSELFINVTSSQTNEIACVNMSFREILYLRVTCTSCAYWIALGCMGEIAVASVAACKAAGLVGVLGTMAFEESYWEQMAVAVALASRVCACRIVYKRVIYGVKL